jgi:LysR family transcriptional regulator, glycine cleavage system transcriptional activator
MRDRLPPLFSLQVFEAAARLGSFTKAAAELKLTAGAISRQIRHLEDWCAQTLFERQGPQVRITREGEELLARLGGPLSALHRAVYPKAADAVQTLQIATLASIAKAWLLPRMGAFAKQHPEIALIVRTDHALTRPPPRTAMVALRHGPRPSDRLHSEVLFEDRLLAVATPARAHALGSDARTWAPRDWLQHILLDARAWFDAAGLPPGFEAAGPAFNDADVLLDAAQHGMGVALTRFSIAWPRLQSGQLVLASNVVCRSLRDNLLVLREDSADLPAVRHFVHWIRGQAIAWRQVQDAFDASDHPSRLLRG